MSWKEKCIKEHSSIADQVDATHRRLTKPSLAASYLGVVTSSPGLGLAPVTVGGSLVLSAAEQGLGAAAILTNISTSVPKNRGSLAARDRASQLVPILVTWRTQVLES